jgi:hypothetical protein
MRELEVSTAGLLSEEIEGDVVPMVCLTVFCEKLKISLPGAEFHVEGREISLTFSHGTGKSRRPFNI